MEFSACVQFFVSLSSGISIRVIFKVLSCHSNVWTIWVCFYWPLAIFNHRSYFLFPLCILQCWLLFEYFLNNNSRDRSDNIYLIKRHVPTWVRLLGRGDRADLIWSVLRLGLNFAVALFGLSLPPVWNALKQYQDLFFWRAWDISTEKILDSSFAWLLSHQLSKLWETFLCFPPQLLAALNPLEGFVPQPFLFTLSEELENTPALLLSTAL